MVENLISSKEKKEKSLKETKILKWKKRKRSLIKEIRRKIFEHMKFLLPIIGGRKYALNVRKWNVNCEKKLSRQDLEYWEYSGSWHIALTWNISENFVIECKSDSGQLWNIPENKKGFVECFFLNEERETISYQKLWFVGDETLEKFKAWLLENKNNLGEFSKDPRPNFLFYKKKKKEVKEKKVLKKKTKPSLKPKTEKKIHPKKVDKDEEIQRLKDRVKTAEYEAAVERNNVIRAEDSKRHEEWDKYYGAKREEASARYVGSIPEDAYWGSGQQDHKYF